LIQLNKGAKFSIGRDSDTQRQAQARFVSGSGGTGNNGAACYLSS